MEEASPVRLVLADFGCAFLRDDEEDHRLTGDQRAVGAVDYRAPEYAYGRVDQVTDAGDIFSFGKLLWYMINGVPGEVFPYNLWYPPRYDLGRRFPDDERIARANLLIASCVVHDPVRRPDYQSLVQSLASLVHMGGGTLPSERLALRLLREQAEQERWSEESEAVTRNLLNGVRAQTRNALRRLREELPGVSIVELLDASTFIAEARVLDSISKGSDVAMWQFNSEALQVHMRAIPERNREILGPFVAKGGIGAAVSCKVAVRRRSEGEKILALLVWSQGGGAVRLFRGFGAEGEIAPLGNDDVYKMLLAALEYPGEDKGCP